MSITERPYTAWPHGFQGPSTEEGLRTYSIKDTFLRAFRKTSEFYAIIQFKTTGLVHI